MAWYMHLAFWGFAGLSLLHNNKNTPSILKTIAVVYIGWHVVFYLILIPRARAKLTAEKNDPQNPPTEEAVRAEAMETGLVFLFMAGIAGAILSLFFGGGGGSCSGINRYSC